MVDFKKLLEQSRSASPDLKSSPPPTPEPKEPFTPSQLPDDAVILFGHRDFMVWGSSNAGCPSDRDERDLHKIGYFRVVLECRDGPTLRFTGCSNCGAISVIEEE